MYRITLLISLWSLLSGLPAAGQNCGCAGDGNCPASFGPNSNTTICYDIEDAFNNNLADPNQGVCGVYLYFEDDRIGALDLTLISPNGTQVQLTGTTGNCNNWTLISVWDILFLPCAEECHPDTINNCALPCVFNNCPTNCQWPNAIMNGTYHPYTGCLENFNSGPANGQWCLQIENSAQFQGGTIFDFEVILCDQSGFFCCDADAGNLTFEPDLNACVGDAALQLSPTPLYGALLPDPDLYGYTYAVFSNGSLLQYDSVTDLRTYPVGTYQLCGLSYFREDSLDLPAAGSPNSAVAIYNNLYGPSPDFCGDIDTSCFIVRISEPPPLAQLTETLCEGQEFLIGATAYNTTGVFLDTILSVGGCDSIVQLDLTVLLPDTADLNLEICDGESYTVGANVFNTTGQYEVALENRFGCDSTVFLDLTVLLPFEANLTETICAGDTFWVGNIPHTITGSYSDTLLTVFSQCDSVVNLDLTVVEIALSIAPPDTLTCTRTVVDLVANATSTLGILAYAWTTVDGTLTPPVNGPNAIATAPGMYYLTVEAANCSLMDSVLVEQETDVPTAVALANEPDTLTCTVLAVQLDATTSTGGPNLDFYWLGSVSDPSSPTPTVTTPGIYEVTVTNLDNGCSDTDFIEIFQDIETPVADAGEPDTLSCLVPVVVLNGSASTPVGGISYFWEPIGGGNIIPPANVPNPQVDAPGAYQLTVTSLANGCSDTDLVGISNDLTSPLAVIQLLPPALLNCLNDTVWLDGSISLNLNDVTFEWIGGVVEGQGTPLAAVTAPGTYSLALLNTLTGCADTTEITVGANYATPVADAGIGPDAITCLDMTEDIGGTGTSFGADFSYQWTSSPGGAFLPGTDQNFIATATAPGTYYLTVTNTISQCSAIDSVVVDDGLADLDAIAVSPGVLTCEDPDFQLDASASVIPPNASYQWQNSAGTVLVAGDLFFTVNTTDSFYFILRLGGCRDTALTVVTGIDSVPVADAGADAFVDCNTNQATLDGSNSDAGANFTYQWAALSGQVVSGETTTSPVVRGVGFYEIEVTDNLTGCVTSDTVQVLLDTAACMPLADAGVDGSVGCVPAFTNLQASGPAGPNFSYQWTMLPGTILPTNGLAPLVGAGTYSFCVTNTAVALTACDTVVVAADTVSPVASVSPFLLSLTCPELAACYALDITGTSQGPAFDYEWVSLSGTICTPENMLQAEVFGVGNYELFVINTLNGCTATDNIIVQLADAPVQVEIDAPNNIQIPCGDTSTLLTATVDPPGGNLNFVWTTPTGAILSGGNTLSATVNPLNTQDVFYFTATNNVNLCTDADSIVVFAPANCKPDCGIAAPLPLDCNNETISLTATGSATGPDISYLWSTGFGGFCSDQTSFAACVEEGGLYSLTVSLTYPNGSVFDSSCSVTVLDLRTLPDVEAGPNDDLNCADDTLLLNGTGSATGTDISYFWETTDGNILNGETTLTPEVDATGTYQLTVTNDATGCSATDFVTIGEDFDLPLAEAGNNLMITCANPSVQLNGSTDISPALFLWTTPNGDVCSDPNLEDINACAAGTYYFTVLNPLNGCLAVDSTTIEADENFPTVVVGSDLFYTCADTVFTIPSIVTAGGSGVLDFNWTTADGCFLTPTDLLQPIVNCPGTYQLTVTDLVNNCSSIASLTVIEATTPPIANAGVAAEINCTNLTLQLNGNNSQPTGQLDFLWSTPDGHFVFGEMTATPTVDSAGSYQLIVTNQFNQCKDTASVVVTMDASIPAVHAGADTTLTCSRLALYLSGNGSATGPQFQYEWTGPGVESGANTLAPLINAPGAYVLEVTDTSNGCAVTDTVIVGLDHTQPNANITATQNLLINCEITSLTLSGNTSAPAGNVSYLWATTNGKIETGTANETILISSGGLYTLTVTDQTNGCTNEETITVLADLEAPFVQVLTPHPLTCDSISVQLRAIPPTPFNTFDYEWVGPGTILNDDTATPTVFQTGIYQVTLTDQTNGCTSDTAVVVTQDISPPIAVASAMGELDCDDLTATVTGTGSSTNNVTYLWTTSTAGNIATPSAISSQVDAAGQYILTVRKLSNGCTATDSALVTANALPIDSASISFQQPDCIDFEGFIFIDSIYGGTPPYSFSLNDSIFVTYPQFSYLDPGSYDLLVQGVNGCTWQTTVAILYPNEVLVDLGADLYISQGETTDLLAQINVDLSEISSIVWTNLPDPVACPNCLEQTVAPQETTTYRITVTDTSGCFASDAVTVFVNEEYPFFVPTAFTPNGDNVNDLLILYAGKEIERVPSFSIYDRWGNRVFHQENFPPNNPNFGWDGHFHGQPMRPAVFAWKAIVALPDGQQKVFYGDLTLVR